MRGRMDGGRRGRAGGQGDGVVKHMGKEVFGGWGNLSPSLMLCRPSFCCYGGKMCLAL